MVLKCGMIKESNLKVVGPCSHDPAHVFGIYLAARNNATRMKNEDMHHKEVFTEITMPCTIHLLISPQEASELCLII